MTLPQPEAEAIAHSQRVEASVREAVIAAGGWLSFERYMAHILYAPGLGYYTAGARKFGGAGDFVTAPELTELFGQALASQVAQILSMSAPHVLEVGAGTGKLAADLLLALEQLDALPDSYAILDISTDLRARQLETLTLRAPHLVDRVRWLSEMPATFAGVVLANELLDALPAHLVVWNETGIEELGVSLDAEGRFTWNARPATGLLGDTAAAIAAECGLGAGYQSEISLAVGAWTRTWADCLTQGALLLLDYGFPRREFYHPQRHGGTLMCHYRHHAHPDPFYWPGLQDVTVHVDFTAVVEAGHGAGLDMLGYTSQGQFLLNCGVLDRLAELPLDTPAYVQASAAVARLLMPHEMGELFKVMALGRGLQAPLIGFKQGDQRRRL